jgi:hypothetical protein
MSGAIALLRIIAVALAISTTTGSAGASPFDPNSRDSVVQQPASSIARADALAAARSGFDWGYIAIGSSAVALVLAGACVAVTTVRRHAEQATAPRKPIARRDRQTTGGRST